MNEVRWGIASGDLRHYYGGRGISRININVLVSPPARRYLFEVSYTEDVLGPFPVLTFPGDPGILCKHAPVRPGFGRCEAYRERVCLSVSPERRTRSRTRDGMVCSRAFGVGELVHLRAGSLGYGE